MYRNELYHYGVKGMKWGVRKLDNRNGELYLKKGTTVKRVSTDPHDRVRNNKKYVSINEEDNSKWEDYLGKLWLKKGYLTTVHSYTTVKDLKVMSTTKQGELYTEMLMDKEFKKMAYKDLKTYYEVMPQVKKTKDPSEIASRVVSASAGLESGQKFINEALNRGYDALFDNHGTNVADNPIIVLNADKNLKEIDKPQYTEAAKNYLEELYEIAV